MRRWLAPLALFLGIALYAVYVAPSSAVPLAQDPTPTPDITSQFYEVRIPYKELTPAPGFIATYLIRIRNLDVLPESYNVEIGSNSGPFTYAIQDFLDVRSPTSSYLAIDAGQEGTIALRVSANVGAVPGTEGTARLFINPRGRTAGSGMTLITRVGSAATPTPLSTPTAANYLPHVSR